MRFTTPLYIAFTLILSLHPALFAQQDTVAVDTVRNRFVPTGIRVGVDVVSLVRSQIRDDFSGWEVQGDVDFDRYFLAFEYGTWSRNFASEAAAYANDGNFWRAGIDVNFLRNDPDRNVFSLGGRYGRSVFTEAMDVTREDPIWGDLSDRFYQRDVTSSWLELTAGLRVKIWKMVWMGYTGRFKFGLSTRGNSEMLPHDVPGYGVNNKETAWGFSYYILVRLPVRNAPVPVAEKKKRK